MSAVAGSVSFEILSRFRGKLKILKADFSFYKLEFTHADLAVKIAKLNNWGGHGQENV